MGHGSEATKQALTRLYRDRGYPTRKAILILLLILALAAGVGAYWLHSARGFSAREKPAAAERWLARRLWRLAQSPGVEGLKNPLSPTPLSVAEARDHFADHCAVCHANSGSGKTQINQGLYPPAPDMRTDTQALTDGEIFYIIKNGIRFTGMPGWGGGDEENWQLVLFIRHLPQLTGPELDLMKEVNHLEDQ